jgi:hypothetical protein
MDAFHFVCWTFLFYCYGFRSHLQFRSLSHALTHSPTFIYKPTLTHQRTTSCAYPNQNNTTPRRPTWRRRNQTLKPSLATWIQRNGSTARQPPRRPHRTTPFQHANSATQKTSALPSQPAPQSPSAASSATWANHLHRPYHPEAQSQHAHLQAHRSHQPHHQSHQNSRYPTPRQHTSSSCPACPACQAGSRAPRACTTTPTR